MTVRELQAEFRRQNASVAGKKADFIQRLEAYGMDNQTKLQRYSANSGRPIIRVSYAACPPSEGLPRKSKFKNLLSLSLLHMRVTNRQIDERTNEVVRGRPSDTIRDINADSPIPNNSKHEVQ